MAEEAVLKANDPTKEGLLTIALRPSGIFGPRDGQGSLAMAQAAKRGQWRVMIGANDNLFDMTYVDNAAHAHVLAADKLAPDNGTSGEVYVHAFFVLTQRHSTLQMINPSFSGIFPRHSLMDWDTRKR